MIYLVIIDDNIAIRINKNDDNCNDEGITVTWTNNDAILHTVVSGSPGTEDSGKLFDSTTDPKGGYLAKGKTFSHTFDTAGTFDYYCTLHPFMIGQIVVK